MSEVTKMSTIDLYTTVRHINNQIETYNRTAQLVQNTIQELLERKQEVLDEIGRRDNERFK